MGQVSQGDSAADAAWALKVENCFRGRRDPHRGHGGGAPADRARCSNPVPHFRHWYS